MSLVAGLCALLLAAPFEARQPLVTLPGQSLSTVEAALLIAMAAAAASIVAGRALRWRTPLTAPWLAFIAAMAIAALTAPAHRANAIAMTGRLALAFGVYVVVVNAAVSKSRVRLICAAVVTSGVVVAGLTILEYLGADPVLRFLAAFRDGAAHVGGQVRAAGPFQYPTIASMFLEVAFAFALAMTVMAVERAKRRQAAVGFAAAALIAQAIVLTFTRAGLITMAAALVLVWWLRWRRFGPDLGALVVAALAVVVVVQIAGSRSLETLRLRLTTETIDAWFRAEIDGPRELTMATGGTTTVPVRVTNAGGATWDSRKTPRIRLSYHWLSADTDTVVIWEGLRTDFPKPVLPGSSVTLDARVQAPPVPGDFRLLWDIEQEHRMWFSAEPDAVLSIGRAVIAGPVVGRLGEPRRAVLPRNAVRPGRQALWRAAFALFAARPLTGIGPDNYRLAYAPYVGAGSYDQRLHSNNMYLEVLVGGGVLALIAFAWLCWAAARQTGDAIRASRDSDGFMLAGGVAAATVAIALHGLVDSFISFTGTYIVIATTLGLGAALGASTHRHAHRV